MIFSEIQSDACKLVCFCVYMFMKVCVCVCHSFLSDVYVWSPGIQEDKFKGKAQDHKSEICRKLPLAQMN